MPDTEDLAYPCWDDEGCEVPKTLDPDADNSGQSRGRPKQSTRPTRLLTTIRPGALRDFT